MMPVVTRGNRAIEVFLSCLSVVLCFVHRFLCSVHLVRSEFQVRLNWSTTSLLEEDNYAFSTYGSLESMIWHVVDKLRALEFPERKLTLSMLLETLYIEDPEDRREWVTSISDEVECSLRVRDVNGKNARFRTSSCVYSSFDDDDLQVLAALKSAFTPKLALA